MNINNKTLITVVACVICVVLAIYSIKVAAPVMSDVNHYEPINKDLDKKRSSVIEISSVLVGLSVVIAAVPGDSTTPLSTQITELSSYLVIALAAIMFEKFILPILGLAVFNYVVPVALAILCLYFILKKKKLLEVGVHLLVLCLALMVTIPLGVKAGNMIDESFGTDSIIADLQTDLESIDNLYETESSVVEEPQPEEQPQKENTSFFQSLIDQVTDSATEITSNVKNAVTVNTKKIIEKAKLIIEKTMDVIAVIIITDIVMPILMVLIMAGALKITFTNVFHFTPEVKIKGLPHDKRDVSQ